MLKVTTCFMQTLSPRLLDVCAWGQRWHDAAWIFLMGYQGTESMCLRALLCCLCCHARLPTPRTLSPSFHLLLPNLNPTTIYEGFKNASSYGALKYCWTTNTELSAWLGKIKGINIMWVWISRALQRYAHPVLFSNLSMKLKSELK